MKKYDAIVIGTGQAGVPLAKKLAGNGWNTAIIERGHPGGTCVNYGCTPTKAMIASARMAYMASESKSLGINTAECRVDIEAIIKRKDKIVSSFRSGVEKGLSEAENIDFIRGDATFTGEKEIIVMAGNGDKLKLTAEKIFINTGTSPFIPPISGLDSIDYFTSSSIMDLREVPEDLLVIGGSYVALEFAQMYKRFGAKVTVVENSKRFLSREDKDISDALLEILKKEGIDFLFGSEVKKISRENNVIIAEISGNEIKCSHVLVATGRAPNTYDLNPDAAGIKTDEKGYIHVNQKLETNVNDVYALGDVKGGPGFTHISYNDYRVVVANLIDNGNKSIEGRLLPYCMFTDPQLGKVGMSEEEAKVKGLNIKVAKLTNDKVARAIETGDTRGMMKAIVDADTGKILGATVLGTEGGEVATVIQMAIIGGLSYHQLKDAVIAHPLYAESLNNLFMTLE